MKKKGLKMLLLTAVVALLGIAAFSAIVMLLWNSTLPAVMHVGNVTIWQAAGILILAKILFSGRRHGREMKGRCRGIHVYAKCNSTPASGII